MDSNGTHRCLKMVVSLQSGSSRRFWNKLGPTYVVPPKASGIAAADSHSYPPHILVANLINAILKSN